mmetsp:Transcript_15390/g.39398  ORF Transcript_15390/g.39398 Transcript_15390/m.39398 type:complete len:130 (-) Transcript_15390:284-673(-)
MFRPSRIRDVLSQALGPDVTAVFLFKPNGLPLSVVWSPDAPEDDRKSDVLVGAMSTSIFKGYQAPAGDVDESEVVMLECEKGMLGITAVRGMVLTVLGAEGLEFGMLRLKLRTLAAAFSKVLDVDGAPK